MSFWVGKGWGRGGWIKNIRNLSNNLVRVCRAHFFFFHQISSGLSSTSTCNVNTVTSFINQDKYPIMPLNSSNKVWPFDWYFEGRYTFVEGCFRLKQLNICPTVQKNRISAYEKLGIILILVYLLYCLSQSGKTEIENSS